MPKINYLSMECMFTAQGPSVLHAIYRGGSCAICTGPASNTLLMPEGGQPPNLLSLLFGDSTVIINAIVDTTSKQKKVTIRPLPAAPAELPPRTIQRPASGKLLTL